MTSQEAISLLQRLIAIPSLSKEEDKTADLILDHLKEQGYSTHRQGNNIWVKNQSYDPEKSTILLNSHHDTVKPNPRYKRDPFEGSIQDEKLYGLGSNDAGGALVSLLATFLYFNQFELDYNLIFAATAEEEISGKNGIESVKDKFGNIDFAIVGEPTLMQMAVAEKGLMVLDCKAHGKAGHAAREEGENAIYKALKDIEWFKNYQFEKVSDTLGPVKMSVTQASAGTQHNVVPDLCEFVVDVRSTDAYQNEEILEIIKQHVGCDVVPRSTRLNPSGISTDHPLVKSGSALGLEAYGSPTLSDQALLDCPSLKIGPGDSARSHTADEFVYVVEIEKGIEIYKQLLHPLLNPKSK